tara:strand:- start:1288 stop:2970 length:1683 start_codon:yes stop_codon:yes gene_type:complete
VRIALLHVFEEDDDANEKDTFCHTGDDHFYKQIGAIGTYRMGSDHVRLRPAQAVTSGAILYVKHHTLLHTILEPIDDAAMHFVDRFHREKFTTVDPLAAPRRRWVEAPAGSGKTTFLLDVARGFPTKNFLLITFSATLSREVRTRARRARIHNLEVRTMDSLCLYASNCDTLNTENTTLGLSDARIIKNFFPKMVKFGWYKKKGARDIASICEMVLRSTMDLHTMDVNNILCDYHSQVSPDYVIGGMWGGSSKKRRLWSYAGNRYTVWHSRKPLLPRDSTVDCVLVDEVQDLDKQAIDIIDRFEQPVIYVGDPNQEIFSFREDNICPGCRESIAMERADLFPKDKTISLYATFRVGAPSVNLLRSIYFSKPYMYSSASPDNIGAVHFVFGPYPPSPTPCCFLFRGNVELCTFAMAHPSARIARGDKLMTTVERVRRANIKKARYIPPFDRFVKHLTDADADILLHALADNFSATESPTIACTVHSAKGGEFDTVAVPYSLFSNLFKNNVSMEERRIAWVACTRHRMKLVVYGVPGVAAPPPKKKRRTVQTTLDTLFLKTS